MGNGFASVVAVAATAVLATGCQTKGFYSAVNEANIVDVSVVNRAPKLSPEVSATMERRLNRRFHALGSTGQPKCLTVVVTDLHLKNPALSLLVGDANRLSGSVASTDLQARRSDGQKDVVAINTVALNGIIGAVQAATQNENNVAIALAGDFETSVVSAVYGSKHASSIMRAPLPPRAAAFAVTSTADGSAPVAQDVSPSPCRPVS